MDSAIQKTSTSRTEARVNISEHSERLWGLPYGLTKQKRRKSLEVTRASLFPSSLQLLAEFRANDRSLPQHFWSDTPWGLSYYAFEK